MFVRDHKPLVPWTYWLRYIMFPKALLTQPSPPPPARRPAPQRHPPGAHPPRRGAARCDLQYGGRRGGRRRGAAVELVGPRRRHGAAAAGGVGGAVFGTRSEGSAGGVGGGPSAGCGRTTRPLQNQLCIEARLQSRSSKRCACSFKSMASMSFSKPASGPRMAAL